MYAGCRTWDAELPAGPQISGPHSQMCEAWFDMIDLPRDYSVCEMSSVGPAASLISTVADLNRFWFAARLSIRRRWRRCSALSLISSGKPQHHPIDDALRAF